jgi:hypothetical protein
LARNAIFPAQQVFEQNLEAEGKPAEIEASGLQRRQTIDGKGAIAGLECCPAGKAVHLGEPFYPPRGGCALKVVFARENSTGREGTRQPARGKTATE